MQLKENVIVFAPATVAKMEILCYKNAMLKQLQATKYTVKSEQTFFTVLHNKQVYHQSLSL